jgi:hypothetical protein
MWRLAAALALVLLATGAAVGAIAGSAAGATRVTGAARVTAATAAAADGPGTASAAQVEQALGVGKIPAALVFIVDITQSMSARHNNLYGEVLQYVPAYLTRLARQDPQDQVAIVLLGKSADTQVLYPLGPPQAETGLPPSPYSDESDFGLAFEKAVDVLAQASSTFKVGQVLLFSDGDVTEPATDDSKYAAPNNNFTGPGWKQLAARVRDLQTQQGMTIGAYDVPLSVMSTSAQTNALRQVFPSVQALPRGPSFADTLAGVTPKILQSKVASAAAPDSGKGVQVTWSGLPASSLDFRKPGHADARLTLRALTTKVPLYLSGLSVTSTGLPATLQESLPDQALRPGQAVTVPVHLTWAATSGGSSLTGGTATLNGDLVLHGRVLSSFTSALVTDFGDTGYTPGSLRGSVSAPVTVIESLSSYAGVLLVIGIILVLALIAALGAALYLTSMRGTLVLTSVSNNSGEVPLRGHRVSVPTDNLIRLPGRLIARGTPGGQVRVVLELEDKLPGNATFKPGDGKMAAGVWVEYEDPAQHGRGSARFGSR